ncbi:diacylglycerol/lipid kinase family protein [Corynebacterium doosanense]|uniref:DAGKc domain-containing protein n=1 Tax=Corynebacterium doosanense CAU 212 = DSM 45436 TaxID=558173 RepID=A0A097IFY3_9CORY|nr:diacylglycerol kinase family protein [Corynebacterium doosanense]AIT61044.1 hypothetical protein CDOO_07110 [Corynebacterium doosanense CAU 212 = DSM 45436]
MSDTAKRSVIIYNPVKVDVEHLHAKVDAAVAEFGWGPVEWVETTEDEPGESQAREAAASGAEMVVACGGDGTVRSVATGLHGSDTALGIIPEGTGNLLARNLGLPLDFNRAVRAAYAGRDRSIDFCHADVVRTDGSEERIHFAVMAGVGIDAQMIVNTDDDLKKRFGVLAYAVAISKSLGGGDRIQVRHQLDDEPPATSKAHSVIIGNCGELVGTIQLIPDAEPDDGILDILVMRPKDLLGWGQIFGSIFWHMVSKSVAKAVGNTDRRRGMHRNISTLSYQTGKKFTAKLSKPEVFEVDGDTVGTVTEFSIGLETRALTVRVNS